MNQFAIKSRDVLKLEFCQSQSLYSTVMYATAIKIYYSDITECTVYTLMLCCIMFR